MQKVGGKENLFETINSDEDRSSDRRERLPFHVQASLPHEDKPSYHRPPPDHPSTRPPEMATSTPKAASAAPLPNVASIQPTLESTGADLKPLVDVVYDSMKALSVHHDHYPQLQSYADRLLTWMTDVTSWVNDPEPAGENFTAASSHLKNIVISDLVELAVKQGK